MSLTQFLEVRSHNTASPEAREQPQETDILDGPKTATDTDAAAIASQEWQGMLRDSEDVLETMLDKSKAFRAERKARKATRQAV